MWWSGARPHWTRPERRRILFLVSLTALAALLVIPTATPPGTATVSPPPRFAPASTSPLQSAAASLVAGHGPISGLNSCTLSADLGSVVCAAPMPSGRPASSGAPVKPATWTDLTSFEGSNAPSPRWLAGMVWDPIDHYTLLFGGYDGTAFSDTWAFVNNSWTMLSPAQSPEGRYGMGLAWDYADGYAVLFGGDILGNTYVAYNNTWTFVHGEWKNITGTTNNTPSERWRTAMTWDGADGYVLMFGGTNGLGSTTYSDTWEFLHGNWTKLTVSGSPPGRFRASMAYDAADQVVVEFGGCTPSSCPDSATWTYHNLTWSSVSVAIHPSARIYYGFDFSTVYQKLLLFGGSSQTTNTPLGDTWAFANDTWTDLTSSLTRSPSARPYVAMAFDEVDNYSVLFGGQWANNTYIGETWVLGPSILGQVTVSPAALDLGQTARINATPFSFQDYVSYNYTSLPPGCTTSNVSVLACQPTTTGKFPIAVVLNDSSQVPAYESATLTVNPDPRISSFTVTPGVVTRGSPVHFAVTATNGTGAYSYKYAGLPTGCSSQNTAALVCTPGATATGTYSVVVTVADAALFQVNATVPLKVNPTPSFTEVAIRPATVDVGQPFTIWANVTGGTGPFQYTYANLPGGCTSQNLSVLTCTPGGPTVAPTAVLVVANDSFGWVASATVNVSVNPDPTIVSSALAPSDIDVGVPVTLWVNVTGGSGGFTYTFTGAPPGCTFVNASVNHCSPTAAGSYTVNVTVTDAAHYAVDTTLTLSVNPALTTSGLTVSPGSVDVLQNVTFTMAIAGGTAPFVYSWSGLPVGCTTSTSSSAITCAPKSANTYPVAVTVTDRWKASVTGGVQLIVYPNPSISSFSASPSPVTVGSDVDLEVSATGGSGVYSYQYSNLPTGCSSSNASILHCTPTGSGSFNVSVTVTDSLGVSTTAYFVVQVNAASGGGGGFLGLPTTTAYALIGAIVVVLVVAIAVVLLMRRRKTPPAHPAEHEEWVEEPPPSG